MRFSPCSLLSVRSWKEKPAFQAARTDLMSVVKSQGTRPYQGCHLACTEEPACLEEELPALVLVRASL